MKKSEIYNEILSGYEKTRNKAEHEMAKRRREIYSAFPEVREIDDEISRTGSHIMRIFYKSDNKEGDLEALKQKVEALNERKKTILSDNGYSPKYLNKLYLCKDCKDTGYIENKKCHCFEKKLIEKYYDMSNMGKLVRKQNFSTFDINVFSDEIPKGETISARENVRQISGAVAEKISLIGKEPVNILFYGSSGLGKTFLCSCIAKAAMDDEKSVVYMSAIQLFDFLGNYKMRKNFDSESVDMLNSCDLLIIDDLGTENVNSFTITELFGIINNRLVEDKSTIISTNLKPMEIKSTYSERFVSRLMGGYDIYRFFGKDVRLYG